MTTETLIRVEPTDWVNHDPDTLIIRRATPPGGAPHLLALLVCGHQAGHVSLPVRQSQLDGRPFHCQECHETQDMHPTAHKMLSDHQHH